MESFIFPSVLLIYFQLILLQHGVVTSQQTDCATNCICITANQVLCNSVGLTEIPKGLPSSLEHLSLTRNNITELRSDAFIAYKNLRKIYLDGNPIAIIRPFAFRGLARLQEISLQNTPLDRIPRFSFAGLHNLTNIYLSHNQIRKIESYAFAGTSALKLLLLTNNPTVRLESAAFSGLSDVEYVYLPVGIKFIDADAFSGMYNIGHLKMIHLDLSSLNAFTFRGLRNVQLLSIQESDLGIIKKDSFTGLVNIIDLTIKNNKIDSIEELKISSNNRVKNFKFIGNHLLDIPPSYAITLEGISSVVANNNHFPCDCRLEWLLRSPLALKVGLELFTNNNFCISPYEVHGKPLSVLDLAALGQCPEPMILLDDDQVSSEKNETAQLASSNTSNTLKSQIYLLFSCVYLYYTK